MRRAIAVAVALALGACGAQSAEPPAAAAGIWKPRPGVSWQIQLQGKVSLRHRARVYTVDGADSPASLVRSLHARGRKVVCYFSAGTYENYREDRAMIPDSVRGKTLADWPEEQWLDIRQIDALGPVIRSRLDTCRRKGFDGVDFDNVDGYTQDSGFPITADDQLRFNRFLAEEAHARGLAAGLKNDLEQIPALVRDFDFAINEQCFQFRECGRLRPFIGAGKAVFPLEYRIRPARFGPRARRLRFSSVYKRLSLRSYRVPC